ncbi:MAG: GGDEF domain-containing protein [Pseudomonadota bacterium]
MRDAILGLVNPLIALIFASIFLAIWSRDRTRKEMLAFAGGYIGLGLGFLWSQLAPLDAGRWVLNLTNIPYFLSSWMIIWGVARRTGGSLPTPLILTVGATMFLLLSSKHLLGADINAELYITNTCYAILFLLGAQAAASGRRENTANALIFWLLAATSFQFFVRPNLTLMAEGPLNYETYRESAYYSILNAVAALNSLSLAIAIIYASVADTLKREREEIALDPLSGVLTRRAFETRVRAALESAQAESVGASLIIADIDHFKQVNDIWGHQVGDRAIRSFGLMISDAVRDYDVVGRIGGEEFCLLIWNADPDAAAAMAERLRLKAVGLEVEADRLDVRLTASFGVADYRAGEPYESLFRRADQALYGAKKNGRNRVHRDGADLDENGGGGHAGGGAGETSVAHLG